MRSIFYSFIDTAPLFLPAASLSCGIALFWVAQTVHLYSSFTLLFICIGLFCIAQSFFVKTLTPVSLYAPLFCTTLFCIGFFLAERQYLHFSALSRLFYNHQCSVEGIIEEIIYEPAQPTLPYCLTVTLERY